MLTSHNTTRRLPRAPIPSDVLSRRRLLRLGAATGLGVGLGITGNTRTLTASDPPEAFWAPSVRGDVHQFALGSFECRVFDDGEYGFPAQMVAINAGPEELAAEVAASGRSMDFLPTTMNILLVDTGTELMLFDTGYGMLNPDSGLLAAGLASEGIAPEDIDIVVLSHMHADHFGGALDETGRSVFANARYLINAAEHDYWWSEPDLSGLPLDDEFRQFFREAAKGALVGLDAQIERIEPGAEIVPGIAALEAYGHTPGHLAFELQSGEESLLHIVDAVGDEMHLSHPDWFLAPDSWPAAAILARRALLNRAASQDLAMLSFHLPFPGLGKVTTAGDGWAWMPTV
jgi:glyoxylase-like metal-dependent hydrolase (beta-lactamase superfamily II)